MREPDGSIEARGPLRNVRTRGSHTRAADRGPVILDSEIPGIRFPDKGMVPRAAQAIVASEAWTDANPMLNLSSFVTTFVEPENREIMAQNATKNYIDHDMCIPVVALTLDKRVKRYNEFDISCKLRERGWVLSAYTMPPDAETVTSLRIVVRPHLNRDVIELLAHDMTKACAWLEEHGGTATPPKLHHAVHKTGAKC